MSNVRKLVNHLNSMGITAWGDAGGRGMSAAHYEPYRQLADKGELDVRVFWTTIRQPATPEQVDKVLTEIPNLKPFQGNDYMDHIGWGESVYSPVTTQLLRVSRCTVPLSSLLTLTKTSTRRIPSGVCAGASRTLTKSTNSNCSA
jgi:hypothetical protein